MENHADPDLLASDEASGSGSTLFFQHNKSLLLTLSLLGLTGNQLANYALKGAFVLFYNFELIFSPLFGLTVDVFIISLF